MMMSKHVNVFLLNSRHGSWGPSAPGGGTRTEQPCEAVMVLGHRDLSVDQLASRLEALVLEPPAAEESEAPEEAEPVMPFVSKDPEVIRRIDRQRLDYFVGRCVGLGADVKEFVGAQAVHHYRRWIESGEDLVTCLREDVMLPVVYMPVDNRQIKEPHFEISEYGHCVLVGPHADLEVFLTCKLVSSLVYLNQFFLSLFYS